MLLTEATRKEAVCIDTILSALNGAIRLTCNAKRGESCQLEGIRRIDPRVSDRIGQDQRFRSIPADR